MWGATPQKGIGMYNVIKLSVHLDSGARSEEVVDKYPSRAAAYRAAATLNAGISDHTSEKIASGFKVQPVAQSA